MVENDSENFDKIQRVIKNEDAQSGIDRLADSIRGRINSGDKSLATMSEEQWSDSEQDFLNRLMEQWIAMQRAEINEIGLTLKEIISRVDRNDEEVKKRLESPEYLTLVRKAFRDWSAAESETKRQAIRNLLSNAAMTRLVSDDVLKLFIEWIGQFSELHFKVMKIVYARRQLSRAEIWEELHGENVREDSAEADLFKTLIHDLSTARVIRQHREVDYNGNFIPQARKKPARKGSGNQFTSAFDDGKDYVLTALGSQFIHYCMNDVVTRIGD